MILQIENLNDTTKILELINKSGKVAGYKINMQKSILFLYINNEPQEREIKKLISFTTASKQVKYLRINLTKEIKDLFLENYMKLIKEIEDSINKWKDTLCLWTGRINIVKITILPKAIYKLNTISIKY